MISYPPVEMYQIASEIEQLVELYKGLKPKSVLEIGSMYGGTLWYWITEAEKSAKICTVDMPVPFRDPRWIGVAQAHMDWVGWAGAKNIPLRILMGTSNEPEIIRDVKKFFPKGIDFLFIDGGHDYATVKSDYDTYGGMVNKGGVIALHDIIGGKYPEYEVWKLWSEIVNGNPLGHYTAYVENDEQGECGIGVIWK